MSKQREAFECFLENVHTNDLWVVWQQAWQAAQADKLEFARKVAELVQVAENNLASFYNNQRACIEDIPPNYTIEEIIAKVEKEQ
jgi:hypothetical protein